MTIPESPRFDAVGVTVSDMERSLVFYRLLGLEFPDDSAGESHVTATLPGGARLMLDTIGLMQTIDPNFEVPTSRAAMTLAFACNSPSGVDSLHAVLVEAGFESHLAPFDAFWGQRYATVLDPDGTHVDLFAALEAA